LQARETAHTRNRYGEPSVQADGVGSFGRPRTWAPATPVACKGGEPPREGIPARVCGGGRQGWRRPNCKGAVPTDSANCSRAPNLLVGVWGATARPGGTRPRAIGGAKALKHSVLLPLASPRSTPILMRSRLGCFVVPPCFRGNSLAIVGRARPARRGVTRGWPVARHAPRNAAAFCTPHYS
jgi:hypothetical protein